MGGIELNRRNCAVVYGNMSVVRTKDCKVKYLAANQYGMLSYISMDS